MTTDEQRTAGHAPTQPPTWHAHAVLPADVTAPRAARRMVTSVLLAWGCSDQVELAELVANELVVEATAAAPEDGVIELQLSAHDGSVLIAVTDDRAPADTSFPAEPAFFLVDRIADEWGVEPLGSGRRVWARIDVTEPEPPEETSG